jgi:hypothetical protein
MRKFYHEAVSEDTRIILITCWRQRAAGNNILNVYLQYNYWTIKITKSITFGVVTAVKIHSMPFCVITPCSLVDWYQGLLGMCCLVRVRCVPPSVVTTQYRDRYTHDYHTHRGRPLMWLSYPYTDVLVCMSSTCLCRNVGLHVTGFKKSQYRPWQTLRVPGGWGSKILRQSAHEGGNVVRTTHLPPLLPGNIPGTHFC